MNIDEILKEINDAVKELNEEGIECSFDNQIIITEN